MNALLLLLPPALEAIKAAVAVFNTIREQARKNGELTDEEDARYQVKLEEMFAQPHWKPRVE